MSTIDNPTYAPWLYAFIASEHPVGIPAAGTFSIALQRPTIANTHMADRFPRELADGSLMLRRWKLYRPSSGRALMDQGLNVLATLPIAWAWQRGKGPWAYGFRPPQPDDSACLKDPELFASYRIEPLHYIAYADRLFHYHRDREYFFRERERYLSKESPHA